MLALLCIATPIAAYFVYVAVGRAVIRDAYRELHPQRKRNR